MRIEQLPIEMLIKIFSFLPRFDEVSLVNKLFYDVACKLNDPNICLKINQRFYEQEWLPSVRNSYRQISKVDIDFPCGRVFTLPITVISIVRKFSASIKHLRINAPLTMAEFLEILSAVPNVEHLVCDCLRLREENEPLDTVKVTTSDLNLHKLQILWFWNSENQFSVVFNRLPSGVLTELRAHNFNLDELTILLQRQANIKNLKLTGPANNTLTADIFDHLKLESLKMLPSLCYNNATVLSKQTKLKSLKLPHSKVDADFMNFVARHFTELETFLIDVPNALPGESIEKINKLKKLKNLSLLFGFDVTMNRLETFAKLQSSGITTLTIEGGSLVRISSML